MRQLVILAALLAALLVAGCPHPNETMNTQYKLTPNKSRVEPAEEFFVDLEIIPGDGVSIAGAQASITFNPEALAIEEITEGDFLKQNGANTFFMVASQGTDNVTGIAGAILVPGANVSAPGTFASLRCVALKGGQWSNFALKDMIAADTDAVALPLEPAAVSDVLVTSRFDVNGDGTVDLADVMAIARAWGNGNVIEDVLRDGIVDVLDIIATVQNFTAV